MVVEERGGQGEYWSVIKSTSPDVIMRVKYFLPKKGERSVATGIMEGVVNFEAVEVATWLHDFNPKKNIRISQEHDQDLARVVVDESKQARAGYIRYGQTIPLPRP